MSAETTHRLLIVVGVALLAVNTGCRGSVAAPDEEPTALQSAGPGDPRKFDLTRDGRIDLSDVAYFAMATKADVTGDQRVNEEDLDRIGYLMGKTYPEDLTTLTASELALAVRVMAADLTGDRAVTASDLAAYGMLKPMAERADVNDDGRVNAADLAAIERNLGHEIRPSISA